MCADIYVFVQPFVLCCMFCNYPVVTLRSEKEHLTHNAYFLHGIYLKVFSAPEQFNDADVFLISNFRRVLYVVCFLLGNSPASEFYMPTFRNTLSVPGY